MSDTQRERYDSARDPWVAPVLWIIAVGLVVAAASMARSPMIPWVKYPLELLCAVSAVLVLWILYGTRYVVTRDRLIARCGPFPSSVPLESIERITPTRDPRAGPALSMDRLHVQCRGTHPGLLISPVPRGEFLETMARRCPHLAADNASGSGASAHA